MGKVVPATARGNSHFFAGRGTSEETRTIEEAGLPYQFLVVVELILYRRVEMDKCKAAAITASIAGAASYVWVSTATCYATEPTDVEPIPLGATLTGTVTGTMTTSSFAIMVISNTMGDEPIKVVSGAGFERSAMAAQFDGCNPNRRGSRYPRSDITNRRARVGYQEAQGSAAVYSRPDRTIAGHAVGIDKRRPKAALSVG